MIFVNKVLVSGVLMKYCFFCLVFISVLCPAQNYVDLIKIGYEENLKNSFENNELKTRIRKFNSEITIPVPLTDSQAIVSGIDFDYSHLQLYPEANYADFYSTTLKLGLASKWNEKWSSSIVFLPKTASDFQRISSESFFLGVFTSFKYEKSENFSYRFGFYGSQEAYGIFATPTFGWYYLSPNKRFEMNTNLPIKGDLNYQTGKIKFGLDYVGISRSYTISKKNQKKPTSYIDLNSLDFSTYIQTQLIRQILFRFKVGYSTDDYELYDANEKLDFKLSAFKFGDNRTQINPKISGSMFFKIEVLYRFDL